MNRFVKSLRYAILGIWYSVRDQPNLEIQVGIAIVVTAAGFYFQITSTEWCVVLLCIGLVIGLEMINTAIENLVDLITRERSALAGKIKDIAAGAVLFASIISIIIGIIIFGKYFV